MTIDIMNFKRMKARHASGTSRQGIIDVSFKDLVKVFGQPFRIKGEKVQAEWVLLFPHGVTATIYDYKEEIAPSRVREWHVGGREPRALHFVLEALLKSGVEATIISEV